MRSKFSSRGLCSRRMIRPSANIIVWRTIVKKYWILRRKLTWSRSILSLCIRPFGVVCQRINKEVLKLKVSLASLVWRRRRCPIPCLTCTRKSWLSITLVSGKENSALRIIILLVKIKKQVKAISIQYLKNNKFSSRSSIRPLLMGRRLSWVFRCKMVLTGTTHLSKLKNK